MRALLQLRHLGHRIVRRGGFIVKRRPQRQHLIAAENKCALMFRGAFARLEFGQGIGNVAWMGPFGEKGRFRSRLIDPGGMGRNIKARLQQQVQPDFRTGREDDRCRGQGTILWKSCICSCRCRCG
jgi:hypothetical protein